MNATSIHRYFLNLVLIPWVFVWGLYAVWGVLLRFFFTSQTRQLVVLPLLKTTDVDLTVQSLYWIPLFAALLSYSGVFFLRTTYPRLNVLTALANILLLVLLIIVQWPVVLHLIG